MYTVEINKRTVSPGSRVGGATVLQAGGRGFDPCIENDLSGLSANGYSGRIYIAYFSGLSTC